LHVEADRGTKKKKCTKEKNNRICHKGRGLTAKEETMTSLARHANKGHGIRWGTKKNTEACLKERGETVAENKRESRESSQEPKRETARGSPAMVELGHMAKHAQ